MTEMVLSYRVLMLSQKTTIVLTLTLPKILVDKQPEAHSQLGYWLAEAIINASKQAVGVDHTAELAAVAVRLAKNTRDEADKPIIACDVRLERGAVQIADDALVELQTIAVRFLKHRLQDLATKTRFKVSYTIDLDCRIRGVERETKMVYPIERRKTL